VNNPGSTTTFQKIPGATGPTLIPSNYGITGGRSVVLYITVTSTDDLSSEFRSSSTLVNSALPSNTTGISIDGTFGPTVGDTATSNLGEWKYADTITTKWETSNNQRDWSIVAENQTSVNLQAAWAGYYLRLTATGTGVGGVTSRNTTIGPILNQYTGAYDNATDGFTSSGTPQFNSNGQRVSVIVGGVTKNAAGTTISGKLTLDGAAVGGQMVTAKSATKSFTTKTDAAGAWKIIIPGGISSVRVGVDESGIMLDQSDAIDTRTTLQINKIKALLTPDRMSLYVRASGPEFGKAILSLEGRSGKKGKWVSFCTNAKALKMKSGIITGSCNSPATLKPSNLYRIVITQSGNFKPTISKPFSAKVAKTRTDATALGKP
jgi:hypothetical protein